MSSNPLSKSTPGLEQALFAAAQQGYNDEIGRLLKQGVNVNAKDDYGETALHKAARWGHIETIKYLIQQRADVHAKDNHGQTALHEAAGGGHTETIKYLIQQGLDVHAKGNCGQTALHKAAHGGHTETIKYLIQQGLDVHAKDNHGQTALHEAAGGGHTETIKYLVQQGLDVHAKDDDGITALHIAAYYGDVTTINHLVSEYKMDIRAKTNYGHTVYDIAALDKKDKVTTYLSQKYGMTATSTRTSSDNTYYFYKIDIFTKDFHPCGYMTDSDDSSSDSDDFLTEPYDPYDIFFANDEMMTLDNEREAEQKRLEAEVRKAREAKEREEHEAREAARKAEEAKLAKIKKEAQARKEKEEAGIREIKDLADSGLAEAQFLLGEMLLLEERDFGGRTTYSYLRAATFQKHGIAPVYLGLLYELGLCGIEQSVVAALFFYEKADNRLALRRLLLGVHYLLENKSSTLHYYDAAGELFEQVRKSEKRNYLANVEIDPITGIPINTQLRSFFERMAAETGTLSVHVLLAIVYTGGVLGAERNAVKVQKHFAIIAISGHARLLFNIGVMYENGIWVEKSYQEAARWYECAANLNLTCAQSSLSRLYRLGYLGENPAGKAEEWAKRAEESAGKYQNRFLLMDEPLPEPGISHTFSKFLQWAAPSEYSEQGCPTENLPKARVLYDFNPTRDDKLPLRKGEVVYVWSQKGNWWLGETKDKREGRLPSNYLALLPVLLEVSRLEDLPVQAWVIKQSEVEFAADMPVLGTGGFGIVREGRYLTKKVAVKQSTVSYADDTIRRDFQAEIETMGRLRHPNIVALYAYTEDTAIPWLVMEYMDGGTFYSYLGRRSPDKRHLFLSFGVVCDINIGIMNGLMYLHSIGLVHRDLKTDNILICTQDGNKYFAKIADFGLSCFCRDEDGSRLSLKSLRSNTRVGTIQYMAPELFKHHQHRYNQKTDMYACGDNSLGIHHA